MKCGVGILLTIGLTLSLLTNAADFSNSWFKPELTIDTSHVCQEFLSHERKINSGETSDKHPKYFKAVSGETATISSEVIYTHGYTHSGCGGACEKYQLLASQRKFPKVHEDRGFFVDLLDISPPKSSWYYFLSAEPEQYLLYSPLEDSSEVHQLKANASWEHVCSISKKPTQAQQIQVEVDAKEVRAALMGLRSLVGGLRRGAGYQCGSMRTHHRWSGRIDDEFNKLLYSPSIKGANNSQYDDSPFEHDLNGLELWSLQGVGEFEALQQFKKELPTVVLKLASFYQKYFKWEKNEAKANAEYAIGEAISSGIRFYYFKPFNSDEEIALRKAILTKQPLSEINKIDLSKVQKSNDNRLKESVLNIAIGYPQALKLLLDSGFDPNTINEFGKTPLMYAAQNNDIESAKLLLEAGGKVNIGTFIPNDNCNFVLKTSNMSPLHYAVRYSNSAFIKLLVDSGASIYSNVENLANKRAKERPIDWLSRFDNKYLTEEDKNLVNNLLEVPTKNELNNISVKLNLEGERLYAKGEFEQAENKFKQAIATNNESIKALNNFSLTALKLGYKGKSLKASYDVIQSKIASKRAKASAYFNSGLACEGNDYFKFDGRRYCDKHTLEYFISAYSTYQTKGRSVVA